MPVRGSGVDAAASESKAVFTGNKKSISQLSVQLTASK